MKYACVLLMSLFAVTAQAQLIVPKGTKATLKVTYQYKSEGKSDASIKDQKAHWRAIRVVEITANYVAEAPQAFAALHQEDKKNKQDMAALQNKAEASLKTMQPTMNDMMKIVEKCNEDEDCISREIAAYGNQMDPATIKTGRQQVDDMTKMATAGRFQLWTSTSEQGTWRIDEEINRQVYEMTCTETRACKSVETRKGSGTTAPPAGTKAAGGASMLEVDSYNKDMMVVLPVPLSKATYTRTLVTNIPDETGGTSELVMPPWMLKAQKPNPVAIPGDLKTVSGTQTYKVDGQQDAGGTITVNWTFTRL